jgi:hypothetical protein
MHLPTTANPEVVAHATTSGPPLKPFLLTAQGGFFIYPRGQQMHMIYFNHEG